MRFALWVSTNGRGAAQLFKTYLDISKVPVYPSTSFQQDNIIYVDRRRRRGQVIIVINLAENIQIPPIAFKIPLQKNAAWIQKQVPDFPKVLENQLVTMNTFWLLCLGK